MLWQIFQTFKHKLQVNLNRIIKTFMQQIWTKNYTTKTLYEQLQVLNIDEIY